MSLLDDIKDEVSMEELGITWAEYIDRSPCGKSLPNYEVDYLLDEVAIRYSKLGNI